MEYKSFDFLKKLYFVRNAGSKDEDKAYKLIEKECKKYSTNVEIEKFKVDGYKVSTAKLKFPGTNINVECVGVGMSGSTKEEGIQGEFVYVESIFSARVLDIENKICLVHEKFIDYKLYKILTEKKVAGIIVCTGSVYDENENVDLDPYMLRKRHYSNGKIPAVCIRMKDAENIINISPKEAKITIIQEEKEVYSHNVIVTIEGSKYKDEIIAFTAHYDSVPYSKGAYDNGTGTCAILEMLAYYSIHKPLRTLKFIFCGAEEMGLEGSKEYVKKHEKELEKYRLCINVDMIGVTLGRDDVICTTDTPLINYIKYLSYEIGFPLNPKQGLYSSDSNSFADKNVPAISFVRRSNSGGAQIHSRKDIIDHLSEKLINSCYFPVDKEIPNNLKEDLEKYFGRKEIKIA